jgi:ABC-2 type transport system permease protein
MNIFHIALREVRAILGTPTGWLVICGFLSLTGVFWYLHVMRYVSLGTDVVANPYGAAGLTLKDHLVVPFFSNTLLIVLFVTPAISMRLFAAEMQERTLELLLTSPVTTAEIVLGKYLGAVAFLVFMLACTFHFPVSVLYWADVDPGLLVGGYASCLLVGMALLAAGTLFSSLSSSQIVALILTFSLGLTLYILSSQASGPDSIASHLSLTPHVEMLLQGEITLADLAYFTGFCTFFLFFTHQQIEARRWA